MGVFFSPGLDVELKQIVCSVLVHVCFLAGGSRCRLQSRRAACGVWLSWGLLVAAVMLLWRAGVLRDSILHANVLFVPVPLV